MKTVTWLFSGQGSQYFQMARELRESDDVFRRVLGEADEIVRPLLNISLVEEIYRPRADRFEPFRRIAHSHPAILIVEYALAQTLLARGLRPDRIAAHSLGEISAFVLAGSLSFETALKAVVKQALVLEYLAPRGAMMVALANPELFTQEPGLFEDCELAGVQFSRSFVLAGTVPAIQTAKARLKARQIDTHDLPVGHPFHTPAMSAVKAPIFGTLATVTFAPTQIPVFSFATAGRIAQPTPDHLWFATSTRTDFPAAIQALEATGPSVYVDLGPSGSMATTIKYNLGPGAASELFPLVTPFGQEKRNIERVIARMNQR